MNSLKNLILAISIITPVISYAGANELEIVCAKKQDGAPYRAWGVMYSSSLDVKIEKFDRKDQMYFYDSRNNGGYTVKHNGQAIDLQTLDNLGMDLFSNQHSPDLNETIEVSNKDMASTNANEFTITYTQVAKKNEDGIVRTFWSGKIKSSDKKLDGMKCGLNNI